MDIILASTSTYRRQLLQRLQITFRCIAPRAEESRLPGEQPIAMVERLALAKARSIAADFPEALVIGSDQVAAIDDRIIGKPGTHARACEQLRDSSDREVRFYTGLALVCNTRSIERFHVEPFSVHFRALDQSRIENYLQKEQPYDCAGSFKCEGLGIALFSRMEGDDPTSLEGLPLIALTTLLAGVGVDVLASCQEN